MRSLARRVARLERIAPDPVGRAVAHRAYFADGTPLDGVSPEADAESLEAIRRAGAGRVTLPNGDIAHVSRFDEFGP